LANATLVCQGTLWMAWWIAFLIKISPPTDQFSSCQLWVCLFTTFFFLKLYLSLWLTSTLDANIQPGPTPAFAHQTSLIRLELHGRSFFLYSIIPGTNQVYPTEYGILEIQGIGYGLIALNVFNEKQPARFLAEYGIYNYTSIEYLTPQKIKFSTTLANGAGFDIIWQFDKPEYVKSLLFWLEWLDWTIPCSVSCKFSIVIRNFSGSGIPNRYFTLPIQWEVRSPLSTNGSTFTYLDTKIEQTITSTSPHFEGKLKIIPVRPWTIMFQSRFWSNRDSIIGGRWHWWFG